MELLSESESIALSAAEQSQLAVLVVISGNFVFDAGRVSGATLRKEGGRFLATAEYAGREYVVQVTREQILTTLGREIL